MKNGMQREGNNELDILDLKEETSDEKFLKIKISEVEERNLWRVFGILTGRRYFKENETKWFDAQDIKRVLKKLGVSSIPQQKLDLMVWEVDENLDKKVDQKEFELMYKKCIEDKSHLEPKNLFYFVQYLMFCKSDENDPTEEYEKTTRDPFDFNPIIVPEDTYFLIYARLDRQIEDDSKRDRLDDEIKIIFGENEKNPDGTDKTIDYLTYLKRVNDHVLKIRKKIKEAQKMKKIPKKESN